jgi:hypothetical protein
MRKRTTVLLIALPVFLAGAAAGWTLGSMAQRQHPATDEHWLSGSPDEKFGAVERHLRGLDQTMAEVGYRFTELYWAGQDRNWEYARYQLDKIETTIGLGLERRPKRAASAAPFLAEEIPAMRQAVAREEETAFQDGIARLRSACMRCHVQENVQWLVVEMPERRLAPIRLAP